MRELPGPWENPDLAKHVWLSHLALIGLQHLRQSRNGGHFGGLLYDKHRLMAEVRAMREKAGERAVLHREGDALYWTYTVHESGRRLPVKILYPSTYPNTPPHIISLKDLPSTPHNIGNELCWTDAHYLETGEWCPARDTGAICIQVSHRWFSSLLVFITKGHWPDGAHRPNV
jgi:ubiquitin-protein ligase